MNVLRASLSDENFDQIRNRYINEQEAEGASSDRLAFSISEKAFANFQNKFHGYHSFIQRYAVIARNYEAFVEIFLVLLLFMFILASICNAVYEIYLCMKHFPHFVLGTEEYHGFLDNVFFVLIGLELEKSVIAELGHDHSYVETVILVAITAVARNIVVLEYKGRYPYYMSIFGLMIGLAINYALTRNMRLRY